MIGDIIDKLKEERKDQIMIEDVPCDERKSATHGDLISVHDSAESNKS